MKRDFINKGPHLGGSSDLTLLAPIKPGFIESLDTVTYKSRVRRILQILHLSRSAAHEYASARLMSDAVERVGVILSVRVAVLEPEDKVMLVVTFDGNWESYIRILWDKVGTLLDLIFCNTTDYVTSSDHSFEQWLAWARRVQVETSFFYGPPDTNARDLLFYRRIERMGQRGDGSEINELRAVLPTAEQAAQNLSNLVDDSADQGADAPAVKLPASVELRVYEVLGSGFQALGGLYRLSEWHRPSTPDGEVLRRAAIDLLLEFVELWAGGSPDILAQIENARRERFARQLAWIFPDGKVQPNLRSDLPGPISDLPAALPNDLLQGIQGGIMRSFSNVTHGVLLFLNADDPAAGVAFADWLLANVTRGDVPAPYLPEKPACTVSFTPNGLRAIGMPEDALTLFPPEYVEGMAARCGLLGDVRMNHPRRWNKPNKLNSVDALARPGLPIDLESIHAVLQLRCQAESSVSLDLPITDASHPLHAAAKALLAANPALTLLSAQTMSSRPNATSGVSAEHFGYADGMGQPNVEASANSAQSNRVHWGEILRGFDNASDTAMDITDPQLPADDKARLKWLDRGSFLVIRKYRQFVSLLAKAVEDTVKVMLAELGGSGDDHKKIIYAKLMGRYQDGTPLVDYKGNNNFNYSDDPQGQKCPLHAHVRLAHPRQERQGAARLPRIMRRGMSYGSKPDDTGTNSGGDRGVVFMAYGASIAEQFEVIQRWLAGGNSTGSSSGQACPIVGVPENGVARFFRFEYQEKVFRVKLGEPAEVFNPQVAPTRLEWGMYLFAPAIGVLGDLKKLASSRLAVDPQANVPWELKCGRQLLASLQQTQREQGDAAALAAWKTVIEDPESIDRLDSAAVWAAIREDHGGLMQTAYGTLVAQRALIHEVLQNADARYSIRGQLDRMTKSFGEIYLGMDAGQKYDSESSQINAEIGRLTANGNAGSVFKLAFDSATKKMDGTVFDAHKHAAEVGKPFFEVGMDAREVLDEVLAVLCDNWFGISDDPQKRFQRGGSDLAWTPGLNPADPKPLYPGHFMALSRYMFQPNPGEMVEELGIRNGRVLKAAMDLFVGDHMNASKMVAPKRPDGQNAQIAETIFKQAPSIIEPDWAARTMVGVMMGFIAPIMGAVANVLREWHRDGSFMAVRAELGQTPDFDAAKKVLTVPLMRAARMRPMPQVIWRTALKAHQLGQPEKHAVTIQKDERVVLALVSGSQQSLADGQDDGGLMFGGRRLPGKAHPTHACPGYSAGVEAMLGILAAIISRKEVMRQGAVPLTFTLLGLTKLATPFEFSKLLKPESFAFATAHALKTATSAATALTGAPKEPVNLPEEPTGRTGLILAAGDSWVSFPHNLRVALERSGYKIPKTCCHWSAWGTIEIVRNRLSEFQDFIEKTIDESPVKPLAVLLSGGGNDSTREVLENLLVANDHKPGSDALNRPHLAAHVKKLEGFYAEIFTGVRSKLQSIKPVAVDIPIIIHGYDHPYPVGAGLEAWLKTPFNNQGYDVTQADDFAKAVKAMKDVIDALNGMLTTLAGSNAHKSYVRYVDLRGTITTHWPSGPLDGWINDIHPNKEGFSAMAVKIDTKIQLQFP